ncbi:MAG: preprotein translocase subunit SecY [Candidatus Eremiobacteraeota bacterium]|nr:preprotein translocase subunit SecY [Candidatus Eremiobacteraeota bacterium]
MLQTVINALKIKDIRNRLLWLCAGFAIFVLMVHISVPGVNLKVWKDLLEGKALFQFLGMFTGGALNKFAIGAMGITPYINASIIMQLLTVVIPKLHELQKEGGDMGKRKLGQYVRSLTMVLALFQSSMMVLSLAKYKSPTGEGIFHLPEGPMKYLYLITVILSLTAGTAFLMWLGELMTDKGIGNGVSLLIFSGIVLRFPKYIKETFELAGVRGTEYYVGLGIFFIVMVLLIMGIIMLTQGQRKVPVQYAKRVVGRKVFGGQSTYIPIRVNNAGVISIIFAISIMHLPQTFTGFIPKDAVGFTGMIRDFVANVFNPRHFFYNSVYFLLVCFFTYFYSAITFNIVDVADNMKKYGGFIPGIRPGRPTAEYLEKILSRITFISAISLGFIAVAPTYVMQLTRVQTFYLGSTSLLIVVGVALDTMQQIEARMTMRHYQGFMK